MKYFTPVGDSRAFRSRDNNVVKWAGGIAAALGCCGLAGESLECVLLSSLLLLIGLILMLWRDRVVLDGVSGCLTKWRGVLVPFKKEAHELKRFQHVGLRRKTVVVNGNSSGGGTTKTVYPVELVSGGSDSLLIRQFSRPLVARCYAEELAAALELPLHDSTSGQCQVRGPRDLNESLRERQHRTGETVALPDAPDAMRSRIERLSDGVVVHFPKRWGVSTTVRGTHRAIVLSRTWLGIPWRTTIPASHLEELVFAGLSIMARSDNREIKVTMPTSFREYVRCCNEVKVLLQYKEEMKYINAVLTSAMSS
jgi:hypothetical protein